MARSFDVKHILAATDMSPAAVPALRYARLFADRFGAGLTVIYCDPVVYPLDGLGVSPVILASGDQEAQLRAELLDYTRFALGARPCELLIVSGQPIPAILESAKKSSADLIVVGTCPQHDWGHVLFASVSDGVLYGSDCPVLTVTGDHHPRGGAAAGIRTIICPVNFSEVARESLCAAARAARAFEAELVVVHVIEPHGPAGTAIDEEQVRRWIDAEVGVHCTYRDLVLRGSAAERVLDCAEDAGADLIVVGAQHQLFRNSTLIGTTADRVIRFASSPVLVVPRHAVAIEKEQREREPAVVHR